MVSLQALLSVGLLLVATSPAHGSVHKGVCYFSVHAPPANKGFQPENINGSLCTHLIYAFVPVKDYHLAGNAIVANTSVSEILVRTRKLKENHPSLKIMVSIGGYSTTTHDVALALEQPVKRREFAQNCVVFLRKLGIDGLDLSFDNPRSGNGLAIDREQFSLLVKELRRAFKIDSMRRDRPMLLLSAAVDPRKSVIDRAYDVKYIAGKLDWISVKSFDLLVPTSNTLQHHSALFRRGKLSKQGSNLNVAWTVKYWAHKGVPREKLLMGLSAHARAFRLVNRFKHGFDDPRRPGRGFFLDYAEVCHLRGVVERNMEMKVPYVYTANTWIGYDDPTSVGVKVKWMAKSGFGGFSIMSLNIDDFSGSGCHQKAYPLLNAAADALVKPPATLSSSRADPLFRWRQPSVDSAPRKRKKRQLGVDDIVASKSVCFFMGGARYRKAEGVFLPGDIDTTMCTHVVYGYVSFDGSQLVAIDFVVGMFDWVAQVKTVKPTLLVLLAIGGWDLVPHTLRPILHPETKFTAFKRNVIAFLRLYGFDGLHLDLTLATKPNFDWNIMLVEQLVEELGTAFKNEIVDVNTTALVLTTGVVARGDINTLYGNITTLISHFAWVAMVTREDDAGLNSITRNSWPLEDTFGAVEEQRTIAWAASNWLNNGCPKENLLIGLSSYGYAYHLSSSESHDIGSPVVPKTAAGEISGEPGILAYYEICKLLSEGGNSSWDDVHKVPYMWLDNRWVSYENAKSISEKANFIMTAGYGGFFFETLDFDDFNGTFCPEHTSFPLLKAALVGSEPEAWGGDDEYLYEGSGSVVSYEEDTGSGYDEGSGYVYDEGTASGDSYAYEEASGDAGEFAYEEGTGDAPVYDAGYGDDSGSLVDEGTGDAPVYDAGYGDGSGSGVDAGSEDGPVYDPGYGDESGSGVDEGTGDAPLYDPGYGDESGSGVDEGTGGGNGSGVDVGSGSGSEAPDDGNMTIFY